MAGKYQGKESLLFFIFFLFFVLRRENCKKNRHMQLKPIEKLKYEKAIKKLIQCKMNHPQRKTQPGEVFKHARRKKGLKSQKQRKTNKTVFFSHHVALGHSKSGWDKRGHWSAFFSEREPLMQRMMARSNANGRQQRSQPIVCECGVSFFSVIWLPRCFKKREPAVPKIPAMVNTRGVNEPPFTYRTLVS